MTLLGWLVIGGLFAVVAAVLVYHEYRMDMLLVEIDRLGYRTQAIDHRTRVERHRQ